MRDSPTITIQGVALVLAAVVAIVLLVVVGGFVLFTRWGKRDRESPRAKNPSVLDTDRLPRD